MDFTLVDKNFEIVEPGTYALIHFDNEKDFKDWLNYLRTNKYYADLITGYWKDDEFVEL